MRGILRTGAEAVLFLTLSIIGLFVITKLSLAVQTVNISTYPSGLLLKSGLPLECTDSGICTQNPRYFWGQFEYSTPETTDSSGNLLAKSGLPSTAEESRNEVAQGESSPDSVWYNSRISVNVAMSQVDRVARERQLDESEVAELVQQYTEGRLFGLLGQPHVNIQDLNRALDQMPHD